MFQSQNQEIVEKTGQLLVDEINRRTNPGDKMSAAMSVSFNAVTSTAAMIMGNHFKPNEGVYPSMDHALLAIFLLYEGCSLSSNADVRVEFSPYRVWEALTDFKKFTGRDGEHLVDQNLMAAIKKAVSVDTSKFGPNSKFLQ